MNGCRGLSKCLMTAPLAPLAACYFDVDEVRKIASSSPLGALVSWASRKPCWNFSLILLSDCNDSGFNSDVEGFLDAGEDSR